MTREQRILDNLGLVHTCANRLRNRGVEYEDLVSAGCIGLCKAADRFDAQLGYAFSTYAVPVILGEMRRLFRDDGAVKISRSMKEKARTAVKMQEQLEKQLQRQPTVGELADALAVSPCEAAELLAASMPVLSLTAYMEDGEQQLDIPVASEEEQIQNRVALESVLFRLSQADRQLILLRYFRGFTQAAAAKCLGISQVQVSRRERRILSEMRKQLTG